LCSLKLLATRFGAFPGYLRFCIIGIGTADPPDKEGEYEASWPILETFLLTQEYPSDRHGMSNRLTHFFKKTFLSLFFLAACLHAPDSSTTPPHHLCCHTTNDSL